MQESSEDISRVLKCPVTGAALRLVDSSYISAGDSRVRFPVEQGVTRAFLSHDTGDADVTVTMQDFYSAHPFPNYDEMESIGSLVEKSLVRGFPELLNRAIPPHARVLEVGCGTGQLGNFLSIANRFVLSVDMTWNSLQLAQKFKDQNGLRNVHFAQMNLFRLPLQPAAFDVVICTGVLHHTSDPYRGFQGLTGLVKPGGILIIGLYNRYGRLQTRMRRLLAKVLGRGVEKLDPYLSGSRLAEDKRRAWYMDQYKNPHESMHTMDEVLGWFDGNGIDFVRAVPSTLFEVQVDSGERKSLFESEDRGSRLDRLLSQLRQTFTDTEGGLFVMIGRRK
jgi:2-polyprenyl-3-methyl-5-hydroxy-6-metoxy-1,4-benzoquinol methylase